MDLITLYILHAPAGPTEVVITIIAKIISLTTPAGLNNEHFRLSHQTFTICIAEQQKYFIQRNAFSIGSKNITFLPMAE